MLIKTSRREWLRSAAYGVGGFAVGGMMPGGGWLGVPQANAAATSSILWRPSSRISRPR